MSKDYLCVATKASNRRDRSEQWKRITHAEHVELGEDRESSIRGCDLGEMRVCAVSTGQYVLEDNRCAHASAGEGLIKFLFIETGEVRVEQAGRIAIVGAGQWCAIDKSLPFRQSSGGSTK